MTQRQRVSLGQQVPGEYQITMDDKDQTQIRPSNSSITSARSKRQKSLSPQSSQPASERAEGVVSQPTGSLADQTQPVVPSHVQPRSTRQISKPSPPPQPILFSGIAELEVDILEKAQMQPPARRARLLRTRRWLRSRTGRVVIPLVTLLIGLAVGLSSVVWYGLSGEGALVIVSPAAQGNLVVDANKDFVTQLVRNNISDAGLPGHVQNVRVDLVHGAKLVVQGDDVYPILFVNVTKHFTVDVQPYVQSCILQIRITHADLGGIPVTTFVQTFQGKINTQLAAKPAGLPSGFTYCTVGVRTEPGGMFVTYRAIPVKQ